VLATACLFQGIQCLLLGLVPHPLSLLLGEVVTRSVSELTSRSSVLALVPSPSLAFSCSSPSLERSSCHPLRLTGSLYNTHRKLI
jgi:hypothetical protein